MPARILIADDEPLFRATTAKLLERAGYECETVADAGAAIEKLRDGGFDLVLSDLNMPGNLDLELLRDHRENRRGVPLIVVTGVPSLPSAIDGIRLGIADYLLKPVKLDDLLESVRRALAGRERARRDEPAADAAAAGDADRFPEMLGSSPKMLELFGVLERVAGTDTNVLLTGESGTGKEVAAEAIHRRSPRRGGPFVVVDCTAIPESLFESVLFGHRKGAFTGAVADREGLLKQADGGTAFFDELGELPLPLQAKLLRAVQQRTFTPVGAREPVSVDVRFVSATNRDLAAEVAGGRFRQDLYYRLGVIPVELPLLRERGEDVLLLADRFLEALRPDGSKVRGFSVAVAEALRHYRWPGNVRELRNLIERAVVLARGERIELGDLPGEVANAAGGPAPTHPAPPTAANADGGGVRLTLPPGLPREEALRIAEGEYLRTLLRDHAGNVSAAARHAGMSRQGLHKLLKQHRLDAAEFRD